ncbi:MAG TPA: 23S rRNA (guanosine(2251)-2'-O)-methyltransferase RlmB [Candidatus Competibacteraceae bacterium]|nr:23S rRNA (guanosine(2251)-2'-O)-methyltransferase RlmB [Candidatus Competibacteraceae bacterium]HQA26760.1 23S rRNA (guanosine(2251)-2'-O)-methyltransferase RlmB [Candidatus Competibacteraceae bacterium]HQD57755.1 23S rRNA (guanosine(2251)-2'-O)-methyltransferase RlmB [Candidatus Competibacteraceae bacterium]
MAEEWIHGLHAVTAALKYEPERLHGLWVERQRRDGRIQALLDQAGAQGVAVHPVDRAELDRLSGGARHQGVIARLAAVRQRSYDEADLLELLAAVEGMPLLLVLDGVQDPHNLGACLRSAAAAGVHAVIAPADRAVGLNATVRKVACGAAEIVPFVPVTNLARTLRVLQEQGVWLVGAAGEVDDTLYDVDFTLPTAIVLGAEEKGLRRLTREICDRLARIPMVESGVESLNVSVATGVFLFEARRQRSLQN